MKIPRTPYLVIMWAGLLNHLYWGGYLLSTGASAPSYALLLLGIVVPWIGSLNGIYLLFTWSFT